MPDQGHYNGDLCSWFWWPLKWPQITQFMVWFGIFWYDLAYFDMVQHILVMYSTFGMAYFSILIWYCTILFGIFATFWKCLEHLSMVWHILEWFAIFWYDLAHFGMLWHILALTIQWWPLLMISRTSKTDLHWRLHQLLLETPTWYTFLKIPDHRQYNGDLVYCGLVWHIFIWYGKF